MIQAPMIDPPDSIDAFRHVARRLLAAGIAHDHVTWTDGEASALFAADLPDAEVVIPVPSSFMPLARMVACHRETRRWPLLYRALWRFRQGERTLLENAADPLVHELRRMEKSVTRDRHHMTAFLRFRSISDEIGERFVAWYEPRHRVLRLASDFFIDRFAAMRFAILTPDLTLFWDGQAASFAPGLTRAEAASGDAVENWWQRYYTAIFNPARLNPRLMQSRMPAHFWRDLPEARLITDLVNHAAARTGRMIERGA